MEYFPFVLGGVAAFVWVLFLKPAVEKGAASSASVKVASANNDGDTKLCRFCAETIKAAAVKCRYCGSELD